ncbi:protocadherin gamma-A11-like isoform X1 [Lepisosteus oculatus]|uniref:protocadherin gamma-A11-like isoform X1 n=1 Tax=Lepisosteus oculatus TaxID=7918 RepID=UPI0035F520CE
MPWTMKWQVRLFVSCFFIANVVFGQVRYSIPEEMTKGSFVGNIAQDLGVDIKRLKSGKARVFTGGSTEYIELNLDKGILVVKDRIDREQICRQTIPCSIHFQIVLESPMELHRVIVEILDVNDNAPTFPKKEIRLEMTELAVPGARFLLESAVDLDVGVNTLQSYTLEPSDHFALKLHARADGSKYVEMMLQAPLDREKQEEHNLILTAKDGGDPQRSGRMKIHIIVLDANDNAPVFLQALYKATVSENAAKGTVVLTVSASDADADSNGEVTYSFSHTTDSVSELFSIHPHSGEILVVGDIDYETVKSCEINIQARDHGGLTDSSKVIIEIKDVNDNAPTITLMSFSSPIPEDSLPGTVLAMLNVEDSDSGNNGKLRCSINQDIPFEIKSSSLNFYTIVTDRVLDRETISEYNITVIARDEGSPPLSSNKTISLKLSDVNDNAPVFKRNVYTSYVMENNSPGLSVFSVNADDADWGHNAKISYFLEETKYNGIPVSSYISVNAESGTVYAVRSLDYEQIKEFKINIRAQDGGSPPLSNNVTVHIFVQDQNDNSPQVLYPVHTDGSLVAEMVPRSADAGYLVTKVVAVDADSGQNAWLSYKLQKATDRALFEVGLQNGEIRTLRQVTDKDAVKQRLVVVVEDNGQPSRSATVNVNVAVADSFPEVLSEFGDYSQDKDYNDNLTFYLVLSLAVVSFLFIVSIIVLLSVKFYKWRHTKLFYHSNANLPVFPSAHYPPHYADVGATGTLQHVYNYEVCLTTDSRKSDSKYVRPCHDSTVNVEPSGTGTLQKEQTMKQDIQLSSEVRYSIPEEMVVGSFVGDIAKDLGLDLNRLTDRRARIFTAGSSEYVELDKQSGHLIVKERIDREQLCGKISVCSFSFEIILENPMELHRMTVEILDVNDNAPLFPESKIELEISESASPGARFSLESAVDPDVGTNSLQSYSLVPTDHFNLKIHSRSGGSKNVEMVLQTALDREKHEDHYLTLTAIDGGNPQRSGTVKIHIRVLDANDNAPLFSQSVYKASVPEDAVKGTVVTTVSATDADEEYHGYVQYYFEHVSPSIKEVFEIDPGTGEIRVVGQLDFEKCKLYEIKIKAKDQGGLTDSTEVVIDIIDINDNMPKITLMSFSSTIAEDSVPGTVIAMINVQDLDTGKNGQVTCSIDRNLPFKIESSLTNYYSLVTDTSLDREQTSQYNITITAADEGVPSLTSKQTLTITISDVNDNAPEFDQEVFSAYVMENNSPSLSLFSLKAKDADLGPNARISYFIVENTLSDIPLSSYISINIDSGTLHAVRPFDYEKVRDFKIVVKAQDGGSPPLSSNVTVNIFVQDQNDNSPQVLYPVHTDGSLVAEMVPRSADVGYLVTKVVAVDADSGQNAWLSYKLLKATDRALFEVGLQNGEIRTLRQVTDKDAVKQRLVVVVEDNGQPSRSATVNVNVAVADSFPEVLSEFSDFSQDKDYNDNLTFYLVLSLAVVSFLFIVSIIVFLSVKFYRWKHTRLFYQSNGNLPVIPTAYCPPYYADIGGTGTLQRMYNYEVCLTTDSRKSDFKCVRPCSDSTVNVAPSGMETVQRENNLKEDSGLSTEQKPPNTDWRFSQGQRPGPSGAPQRPEEAGPWPNPPTEAEQLQALMAAANEVSEATNTLGASTLGPGTMGLSTRYSPQFTLQHVPDYRQNIYIPGSTATLTGNNPQAQTQAQVQVQALPQPQPAAVEAPKPAQTPANKKKSGKKEKK